MLFKFCIAGHYNNVTLQNCYHYISTTKYNIITFAKPHYSQSEPFKEDCSFLNKNYVSCTIWNRLNNTSDKKDT